MEFQPNEQNSARPGCSVTIDLDGFKAVSCTQDFYGLLGFQTEQSCLHSFEQLIHFQDHNFFQMFQIARSNSDSTIPIVNRFHQTVGSVEEISLDLGQDLMRIEVTPRDLIHKQASRYLAPVTLHLNQHLEIISLADNSDQYFNPGIIGLHLIDALVPPGLRARIKRIYAGRLARHNRLVIEHSLVTRRHSVDIGLMRLVGLSDRSFLAEFYPLADSPRNGDVLLFDMGRHWAICSQALAESMGIDEHLESRGINCWLDMVLEEDRAIVRQLLNHPDLPDNHQLFYRMSRADGIVVAVEHRLHLHRRRKSGHHQISSTVIQQASILDRVCLQTIALAHQLHATSNELVHLHQQSELSWVIKLIRQTLANDGLDPTMLLSSCPSRTVCSVCGETPDLMETSIVLTIAGMHLDRRDLRCLNEEAISLVAVNGTSTWRELFAQIHNAGFHLLTEVRADQRLVLNLTSSLNHG